MSDTRRSFLKFLGLSAPAALAKVAIGRAAEPEANPAESRCKWLLKKFKYPADMLDAEEPKIKLPMIMGLSGKARTDCFRFACDCGENIVLPVPKDVGNIVVTNCPQCHHLWHFKWQGDCLKTWDYTDPEVQI